MKQIQTLSVNEKIDFTRTFITEKDIEDQDIQQELYLTAMEFQCFDVKPTQYMKLSLMLNDTSVRLTQIKEARETAEVLSGLMEVERGDFIKRYNASIMSGILGALFME